MSDELQQPSGEASKPTTRVAAASQMNRKDLISTVAGLTANLKLPVDANEATLQQARVAIAAALSAGLLHTAPEIGGLETTPSGEIAGPDIHAAVDAALSGAAVVPTVAIRAVQSQRLQPKNLKAATAGRAVTETLGPFIDGLGRPVFIDTFEPIELVGIQRAGQAKPFLYVLVRPGPGTVRELKLGAGSIWIAASVLDPVAPIGGYVGLRIKGGSVRFDTNAAHASNVITIPAISVLELDLKLDPRSAQSGSGPGTDARQAVVSTPDTATFHFAASGATVPRAAAASLLVLGWHGQFGHKSGSAKFDISTARIEVSYDFRPGLFKVTDQRANLVRIEGEAIIARAAWSMAVTIADPSTLGQAAGAGGMTLHVKAGLQSHWEGRDTKASLGEAALIVEPGGLEVLALEARSLNAPQHIPLWKGLPNSKAEGWVDLRFAKPFAYAFVAESVGLDGLVIVPSLQVTADRPVTINGELFPFASAAAFVVMVATAAGTNILIEAAALPTRKNQDRAIALKNLVMRVSEARALIAFGSFVDGACVSGVLAFFFQLRAVLPILPDPYAANLLWDPRRQEFGGSTIGVVATLTKWAPPANPTLDILLLSGGAPVAALTAATPTTTGADRRNAILESANANVATALQQRFAAVSGGGNAAFVLLDVSTNASLFGVGFAPTREIFGAPSGTPTIAFDDLYLSTQEQNVRILTLPPVQWEAVTTTDDPNDPTFPSPLTFPNSGGGAVIATDSVALVRFAPRPAIASLLANYEGTSRARVAIKFTLPFGIEAVAELQRGAPGSLFAGPSISDIRPSFTSAGVKGGIQLRFQADTSPIILFGHPESPSFPGIAQQLHNARFFGSPITETVLTPIDDTFNSNFGTTSTNPRVPVTRFDLSGYGESIFSDWVNPADAGAIISKAQFEVFVGRTRLEVVQAHSLLYPFAVRVIRTITMERGNGAGVMRKDSGWQAASDGRFEFPAGSGVITHPGVVRGVTHVTNIRDTGQRFTTSDGTTELMAVRFDCMVDMENTVNGAGPDGVPARDLLGYVQLTNVLPMGPDGYGELLAFAGPLGGAIDCTLDIGASGQKMRVSRIGVAATPGMGGPEFSVAAWGSPSFPGGGTWSFLCQHSPTEAPSGVDLQLGVPVVRAGAASGPPSTAPYRFADPQDTLIPDTPNTEYGIVHSTGTQRTYFPRPKIEVGSHQVTSVRAPFLADPYSLGTAIDIFPQLGVTIPFPDANYSLNIAPDGNYTLQLPTASFQPPRLQRTLLNAPPVSTIVEYADEAGNPCTVTVTIETAAAIPWSILIQNLSVATRDGDRNEITRVVGDLNATAQKAASLENSRLVFGGALQPVQQAVSFLENFGPIPPVTVAMTNDASIKAGLKIDFEKILETNPVVGAFMKKFVVDLDFEVSETIFPHNTEAEANFELTLKIPTPFTPVVAIAIAKFKIQLNSDFGTSYTFTIGVGIGVSYDVGDFNITAYFAETIFLIAGDNIFGLGCSVLIRGTVDLVVISIEVTVEAKEAILRVDCDAGAHSSIWGVAQLNYSFDVTICWVIDIEYDAQIQTSHNFDGGPCALPDVL